MVAEIRKKFELLLLRPAESVTDEIGDKAIGVNTSSTASSSDDVLTPGQMLLMGFNGLFEKLQLEGNALIAALDTLDTPHCWKKVDQVWEAKAIAVSTDACKFFNMQYCDSQCNQLVVIGTLTVFIFPKIFAFKNWTYI
jgi:hypothetical protein